MTDHLGLDPLLAALREAGLQVGVNEVIRLQRVFELQPDLPDAGREPTRRRLKALLRAVLVKNNEDRDIFDRVCDGWLTRAEQDVQILATPAPSGMIVPSKLPGERQQRWWDVIVASARRNPRGWYGAATILVLLAVIAAGVYFERPVAPVAPVEKVVDQPKKPDPETFSAEQIRQYVRERRFQSWVPTLEVSLAESVWAGWFALSLGALALVAAGGLWFALGRRRWLPEPAPTPTRQGPPRVFLQPPQLKDPQLLDSRQQEALVWGIGRFVADEPTRRLDLPATVNATARTGGIPELRFQYAYYQHEVWLWLDEAAEDAAIERLAEEVETILNAHGLSVERAAFRGIPERLTTAAGTVFAPREIDERREVAVVAVLTDGRMLTRQYAADDKRVRIDALLRGLSHWPKLAFVDFAASDNGLAWILEQQDLELIAPTELANFLGGVSSPAPAPESAFQHKDEVWAAACAIAPSSVDETTAFELRERLGLASSPWALRVLRSEAPGPGGRLQWTPSERARRINWLREAETDSATGGIVADSLLNRALEFWETRYELELRDRKDNDAVVPWEDTPAQQHLLMELSLLRLWRRPDKAISDLYPLYHGRLRDAIRQQLGQLAPLGSGTDQHIQLPWFWTQRSVTEKAMLQEMGFGGDMPTEHLKRPGRLWLGLSGCLGLALGALVVAALRPVEPPTGRPGMAHDDERPAHANEDRIVPAADGRWRVVVTTPKWIGYQETDEGVRVEVDWQLLERACVETLDDGKAEIWRCSRVDKPPRLSETIQRSLVVLMADLHKAEVEDLAIALLDSGSADLVLVDPNWPRFRDKLIGGQVELEPGRQLIVITTESMMTEETAAILPTGGRSVFFKVDDWSQLRERLRFAGVRDVTEVWPDLAILALNGNTDQIMLRGLGDEIDMEFVDIPPDTFRMGSADFELARPVREVTLGQFQMGKYEVTFDKYDRFAEATGREKPNDFGWGRGRRPAINVSWHDAKAFCEYYGYRLPTEAEWEHAARAGTETRYWWGDELGQNRANCDGCGSQWDNKSTAPVGSFPANPFGLHDTAGNVWEWVQDCWHGSYEGAPNDGSAWEEADCSQRVLRGGAFDDRSWDLRSAYRDWIRPEDRDQSIGFRCARGPRRQL